MSWLGSRGEPGSCSPATPGSSQAAWEGLARPWGLCQVLGKAWSQPLGSGRRWQRWAVLHRALRWLVWHGHVSLCTAGEKTTGVPITFSFLFVGLARKTPRCSPRLGESSFLEARFLLKMGGLKAEEE